MAAGGSNKAVVAALAGNSAIAVAKFVGFFITCLLYTSDAADE